MEMIRIREKMIGWIGYGEEMVLWIYMKSLATLMDKDTDTDRDKDVGRLEWGKREKSAYFSYYWPMVSRHVRFLGRGPSQLFILLLF